MSQGDFYMLIRNIIDSSIWIALIIYALNRIEQVNSCSWNDIGIEYQRKWYQQGQGQGQLKGATITKCISN